jgi:hypothetical protein
MSVAFCIILAHAIGAVALGWIYFRRYRIAPPPLGVLDLGDIAMMIGGIVLVPFFYLLLPRWFAVALLAVAALSLLHTVGEPVVTNRRVPVLLALVLLGADIGAALWFGPMARPFLAVNNLVLVALVVGITNLWAQGGMKARDAAVLGGLLALYDVVATSVLPLTDGLFDRLAGLPLAPLVAWPTGDGRWLGLGLGDLLLATLFPLVARKAYGRASGLAALACALVTLGALLALVASGVVRVTIPVMVVLGPLMVVHYACWRWRRGPERTTRQYLRAEPIGW